MTKTIVNPFTSDLQKIVKDLSELDVNVVTITNADSPFTMLTTIDRLNCDTSSGAIAVTLPAMSNYATGDRIYHFKKFGANVLTISQGG